MSKSKSKSLALLFVPCLIASMSFAGDSFLLKYDKTARTYGPFNYIDGELIEVGNASFTLLLAESEDEAVLAQNFEVLGYDGIPLGADLKTLKKTLINMDDIITGKTGKPVLRKVAKNAYAYSTYRATKSGESKSKVRVDLMDGRIISFTDELDGLWKWHPSDTDAFYTQLRGMLIRQWGEPTRDKGDDVTWTGAQGKASLELKRPAEEFDFPAITITVSEINSP